MTQVLLTLWLASLGVDWPALPGNARLADVLFVPAALAMVVGGGPTLRLRGCDAAVIAYVVGSGVGLIATSDRTASLTEVGRHLYLALTYLVVALAIVRGYRSTVRCGLVAMGAVLAIPALAFAMLFQMSPFALPMVGEVMNLPYAGDVLRLRALTASPTMFSCLLTVALPFAIAGSVQAADDRARRLWIGSVMAMGVALVMTFSHVWAGAALAAAIVSWPLLAGHRALRVAGVVVVVGLTIVFNASLVASVRSVSRETVAPADRATYPYAIDEGRVDVAGYHVDYAVMSYFRLKQLAWEAFAGRPLTGVGLDRFHEVTLAAYEQRRLPHMYRLIDPHSALLGRLAETGVAGGLTLIVLWGVMLRTGARLASASSPETWDARAGLAAMAGLLLAGINVDFMNFRFAWAAFGVLRGISELRSQA